MDNLAAGHIGQELHLRALVAFQKRTEAQMIRVQQYFEEDAAGLNRHEERLNALAAQVKQQGEQMSTLSALVNRLMASDLLTADHQGEMRARIQAVAHQAGQSASAIEHELAAAFGVETIGQLPEARWGEIAAWFHQRLGW
jgi:chromosome condensin MukBEF ATPase and DNA-binding subunit MukB